MKSPSKCPNCGEPVSQFAAGCAICGADLVAHRRELEERRVSLPSAPRLGGRFDPHTLLVVFTVLATFISPLLGLLLAGLGAQDRHRSGLIDQRNLFLVLIGVNAFLFLFAPIGLISIFSD